MKRLAYILLSALLFTACSDDLSLLNGRRPVQEGDPVTLTVSINAPDEGVYEATRALGEMNDDIQKSLNLWVFVFDANGLFVQAAKAEVGDNTPHDRHTDTKFTVTLNATSEQRIIHFIAYDGAADAGIGEIIENIKNQFGTESSIIGQQLYTENGQAAYWQRWVVDGIQADDETTTGVDESTKFECVPLVRNFSKVTVAVKEGLNFTIDGYALVNTPSRGTVAPYNSASTSFVEYVDGKQNKTYEALSRDFSGSTPTGTAYARPAESDLKTEALYLYETPNASDEARGRTSLIVKGHVGTTTSSYYKVDLIYTDEENEASGNMFYNILRNFLYKVTIDDVKGDGYATLDAAIKGAANNNLSASTATTSLSRISDGQQMIEVSNIYYCFTEGGVKQVLKYQYRYYDGDDWIVDNSLVRVTASNNALFNGGASGWSVATSDDADGWRLITMDLVDPTAQPQSNIFHIYASLSRINASSLSQDLKSSLTSGEMLYRDVRIDLRNRYTMLVDCPSYVAGAIGSQLYVNLLIPQGMNEALFPMDILVEPQLKSIYPNTASDIKLPVNVGPSIVPGQTASSFQYKRTISKLEYASLETKTINGVTYKVVPCHFKTNIAVSATTVYAANEYFQVTHDAFTNTPVAFADDTQLTIECDHGDYFGRQWPVTMTFYTSAEAMQTGTIREPFKITVTEGNKTTTYTQGVNLTITNTDPVSVTIGGVEHYTYYRQRFTYYTQTINGGSITAKVTATAQSRAEEERAATFVMNRRYFIIGEKSFKVDFKNFLDESATGDGSSIYVKGTYVGWFGRGLSDSSTGYLTADGPLQNYVIDHAYQNYETLTDDDEVYFQIYNPNHDYRAYTTIGELDAARIAGTSSTLQVEFNEVTTP